MVIDDLHVQKFKHSCYLRGPVVAQNVGALLLVLAVGTQLAPALSWYSYSKPDCFDSVSFENMRLIMLTTGNHRKQRLGESFEAARRNYK